MSFTLESTQPASSAEVRVGPRRPPVPPPATGSGAEKPVSRFAAGPVDVQAGVAAEGMTAAWYPGQVDPAVVAFHDRYSSACEQFRSIRARLTSMAPRGACSMIALTSSLPQEGKSVCTVNLGLVLAEGGEHRVLIADADFRRSSIGRMLGLPARPGLAEYLGGEALLDQCLCPSPFPNLRVLLAGRMGGRSVPELLSQSTARERLSRLRGAFDYVLLDTPPVNTVSDVTTLGASCDGALLVVEMRRTPEPAAQRAVRTLQGNNIKILGCILTRHDDRPTHGYDRYYHNHHST